MKKRRFFTPHPPLRGTLSLRERNSRSAFPYFDFTDGSYSRVYSPFFCLSTNS